MTTVTRWALGPQRLVVVLWTVVTIAAFASMGPAGDAPSDEFAQPGREGFEASREIAAIYGTGGSDVTPIVPAVTLPSGTTVDSPGVREEFSAALGKVEAALPRARSASYVSTGDRAFVSAERACPEG